MARVPREIMDTPDNPTAENAATVATKPVVNRATQVDPNAPAMPQAAPSGAESGLDTNPDPNAYAPPPQETAVAHTGAPVNSAAPGPITPPPALPAAAPSSGLAGWSNTAPPPVVSGGTDGTGWVGFDAAKTAAATPMTPAEIERMQLIGSGDPALQAEFQKQYGAGWRDKWNAEQNSGQERYMNQTNISALQNLGGKSGAEAFSVIGSDMRNMNTLRAMSPEQRTAFLDQWKPGSYDRQLLEGSLAAQGITIDNADTGRRWDGATANMGAMASAIPVYQQVGGTGVPGNTQGEAFPGYNPATQAIDQPTGLPPVAASGGMGDASDPRIAAMLKSEQERMSGEAARTGGPSYGNTATGSRAPQGGETAVATPGRIAVNNAPGSGGDVPRGTLPPVGPSGGAPAAGMGSVAQTAVTPQNALTNSMLARVPGADRFKIAQDQYDAAEAASAPQYKADLDRAMRLAAAGGSLGSGKLQTSLGDIAQNRDIQNRSNRTNLLSEALKGTIGDQFQDVGIAQQQQGFQKGQQEQAFGNEVTQATLQEALKSGDFNRALQMLTAGSSNNPSDTALALSQIFGGQSSAAGSSLAALLSGMGQKNATPTPTASSGIPAGLADWLKKYAGTLGQGGVG